MKRCSLFGSRKQIRMQKYFVDRVARLQSCPWVGLIRGLGWAVLGWYWVRNFCFQWVGLGHGSELADFRKTKVCNMKCLFWLGLQSLRTTSVEI